MKARLEVDPGVCGFTTVIAAECGDMQNVTFEITSDCEKVMQLAAILGSHGPVDAFAEISPVGKSVIFAAASEVQKGCCKACAVTLGVYKAMQVAAGLALPRNIAVTMSGKE